MIEMYYLFPVHPDMHANQPPSKLMYAPRSRCAEAHAIAFRCIRICCPNMEIRINMLGHFHAARKFATSW